MLNFILTVSPHYLLKLRATKTADHFQQCVQLNRLFTIVRSCHRKSFILHLLLFFFYLLAHSFNLADNLTHSRRLHLNVFFILDTGYKYINFNT